MKRSVLILFVAALGLLVAACTVPGVGHYQRALELGCTTSDDGLSCPGG